jgi:hypothetical protein
VFKDYLLLAEHPIAKRKYLYLLGTEHALKFLRGGRALSSMLNRDATLFQCPAHCRSASSFLRWLRRLASRPCTCSLIRSALPGAMIA